MSRHTTYQQFYIGCYSLSFRDNWVKSFWLCHLLPEVLVSLKKRQRDRRSRRSLPFSAAAQKFFLMHFSPNYALESFETMLFFAKIFSFTSNTSFFSNSCLSRYILNSVLSCTFKDIETKYIWVGQ